MKEIWKKINGFEDYEISNFGRVKSFKRNRDIILKPRKIGNNYLGVQLYKQKCKNYKISRLVAIHFIPNPSNLPCINHKDLNKHNDKVDNLEWCSYSYNNKHSRKNQKYDTSNMARGERNGNWRGGTTKRIICPLFKRKKDWRAEICRKCRDKLGGSRNAADSVLY